jgi:hypothetical protein
MDSSNDTHQETKNGQLAREKWAKDIEVGDLLSQRDFNIACGNVFEKEADIILDDSTQRQTVIMALPTNAVKWKASREKIYTIVKDGKLIKIGGTRTGMHTRWASYLCGHHVIERGKSGKMSVTNAHLYHSIELDLLDTESKWELYTWTLPVVQQTINILGEETIITSQTYHAYESCCIKKYKTLTGILPILCDNCDPKYK